MFNLGSYIQENKDKRDKFRVLRKMSIHELSELDIDFNMSVLTDENAYCLAVLTKEEYILIEKVIK